MKNIKLIFLIVFLGIYIAGMGIGSVKQIKDEKQDEMYAYLENAVSDYSVTAAEGMKSVACDNAKILAASLFGGLFIFGPCIVAAVIFFKGYAAGFAITAVLRLYGLRGLTLCGANILSAVILIPALLYYGSASAHNLIYNRREKGIFLKKYLVLVIFLTAILCADSLVRGFFSSIFMKLAAALAENV